MGTKTQKQRKCCYHNLNAKQLTRAQLRMPKSAITMAVQVDRETFAWFQAQGESAQQQMSVAVRIDADAHKTYPAFVTKLA